jgi:hypothetical protein
MEISETESTLQEYEIQLEQVEIALKSDPSNEELLKLKQDLIVKKIDYLKSNCLLNVQFI